MIDLSSYDPLRQSDCLSYRKPAPLHFGTSGNYENYETITMKSFLNNPEGIFKGQCKMYQKVTKSVLQLVNIIVFDKYYSVI